MDAPKKQRGTQPRWTEAEDAILRATYPDGGKRAWAELRQAGAKRSQMAVYLRARDLGLKVTGATSRLRQSQSGDHSTKRVGRVAD